MNINRRQNISPKKCNLTLANVSLCFSPFAVVLPALYNFLYREWNIRNCSAPISAMFFTFTRKTLRETLLCGLFLLNACEAPRKAKALQAANCACLSCERGDFGAKLTHLCGFSLDVSFFSHVKKHRDSDWTYHWRDKTWWWWRHTSQCQWS